MRSPSIFAWCDPWLVRVVSNYFHTLIVVHRVHCSEKTRIACPFWDFFLLGSIHFWLLNMFHLHFRCGICTQWSHPATVHSLVMQINEITSWMSLICSEIQEMLGRVRVQATLSPFPSSFCLESYPTFNWPFRSTIKLCLELFCQVIKSHCSSIFSRNWWTMSQ